MSLKSPPEVVAFLGLVNFLVRMVVLFTLIRYRHAGAGTTLMIAGLVGTIVGQMLSYPFSLGFLIGPIIASVASVLFFAGLWRLLRDVHSRLSLIKPVKDPLDELS